MASTALVKSQGHGEFGEHLLREDQVLKSELKGLQERIKQLQVAEEELRHRNEEVNRARIDAEAERERYRELFESVPDGYILTDAEGLIQEANRAAAALLNKSRRSLAARPINLFVEPGCHPSFSTEMARAGRATRNVELPLRLQPSNAPAFDAIVTVSAVRDLEGELVGFRWLLRDISAPLHEKTGPSEPPGEVEPEKNGLPKRAPLAPKIVRAAQPTPSTPGLIHSVSPATKSRNGNGAARVVPMQDRQAARATIENDILASLPDEELNSLLPELVPITLNVGDVLFDFEERVRYVYFPNSGLVSLLSTMKDGATVEVSMIGKHGAADIFFLLDNNSTPYRAIVEIPGSAMRIRAEALRKHFDQSGQLQKLLLTYLYNKLLQTAQAAACNCFHSVKERLCRRLLEIADCLQSDDFRITQELLAVMLGVRRSGISVAAGILQNEKLIDYSRGRIALLDSAGLEAIACECYSIIKYDYKIRF